jgi:L-iditol 2-dehydrogenase
MLAAVLYGINSLVIEERVIPKPNSGEIVVQVDTSGLCPSDVKILRYGSSLVKYPVVLGHEFSGIVYAVGSDVADVKEGEMVNIPADAYCGVCKSCRVGRENICSNPLSFGYNINGAHQDYILVPKEFVKRGIFKVPDKKLLEEASMTEPLACVIHSVEVAKISPNKNVVIIGDGPMGLLHALVSKIYGANKVILIGLTDWKLKLGKEFGATHAINSKYVDALKEIREICPEGVDATFLTVVNSSTFESAVSLTSKGGVIDIFAGVPKNSVNVKLDPNIVHYNEVSIIGSSGYTYTEYAKAFDFIVNRKLNLTRMVSHRFPLEKINEAISAWDDKEKSLKILLKR